MFNLSCPKFSKFNQIGLHLLTDGDFIDDLQIGHKGFSIFPNYISQAVADLVDGAVLDTRFRKYGRNGVFETGQSVYRCQKHIFQTNTQHIINSHSVDFAIPSQLDV
jgi:hypothetical protein